ncbi:MAG: winged helix-turn-helix transcriptional regulator [Clostridia bacterium]|nr:winged helix-turn-helix transcriptional regulator [Clostridia bacterium]
MKKEETKTKNESTVSTSVKRQPDETCCRGQSIEEFALPGVTDLSHLANFFKILGDRTRLKILMLLEKEELCVHTIAKLLNSEQSVVSHQLKTLKNARIVSSRRAGKHVFYRLCDDHIASILDTASEHTHELK